MKRSDHPPADQTEVRTDEVEKAEAESAECSAIRAERDQFLDQLQRTLADFANYRRRVEQERGVARQLANRDLLLRLVPISDDFRRAFDAIPQASKDEPWVAGMALIERNLSAFLEREGVRPIEALGQPFDPALHEAVAVVPGSSGAAVVDILQNGYWHGDQVLRPAMVMVGDTQQVDETEAVRNA
ncbi:MAG: nucleotide exchange factor GrpE [Thermomicrobiales bacterium]